MKFKYDSKTSNNLVFLPGMLLVVAMFLLSSGVARATEVPPQLCPGQTGHNEQVQTNGKHAPDLAFKS